jgi:prophage regulatory protein
MCQSAPERNQSLTVMMSHGIRVSFCSSVTECATTMQLQHLQAACGARMPSKILRLPSVLEISGLSRSSIYLRVAQGIFPKQVSLGARAIRWRESDVQTWIECLLEKR